MSGGKDEAVQQPLWLSDSSLAFISDRESGWWNLWRETSPGHIQAVIKKDAEFGYPPWIFGYHTYAELPDGRWVVASQHTTCPLSSSRHCWWKLDFRLRDRLGIPSCMTTAAWLNCMGL